MKSDWFFWFPFGLGVLIGITLGIAFARTVLMDGYTKMKEEVIDLRLKNLERKRE